MKKNKLIYVIFAQIFIISTVFIVSSIPTFNSINKTLSKVNNNDFDINTSSWSNAIAISDIYGWNDGDSNNPSIAIDNNSVVHVVWHDFTDGEWGNDCEIMYANYTAAGWSNATVISDDSTGWNDGNSQYPSITIDNNQNIHVVWNDFTNGEWGNDWEIMYANRTVTGWSNATVISDIYGWNNKSSHSPSITIDNNQNIHVVWYDNTEGEWGTDWEIMYANRTVTGWSNATVISDIYGWNNGNSYDPSIATDKNDNIHVVWHDDTDGEWGDDIEIMYANNTGTGWSNATVISDIYGWNNETSVEPSITIGNDGNIHVVWSDDTNGEWGIDNEIMYANYTAAGWSNATVISDDSTDWNTGLSDTPCITIDNDLILHVVWHDETDGAWGTDDEIMYAKYTAAGWSKATVISDDSTGWNDDTSEFPSIAVDNNSVIHVVWQDETDGAWGDDLEIMYLRYSIPKDQKQDLGIILLLAMQQPTDTVIIFVIIGIGATVAVIIFVVIIKREK